MAACSGAARPLRVLMSCERFAPVVGGLERQALQLARGLASRGIHVEVATRRLRGLARGELVDGIAVTRLGGVQAMGPSRVPFVVGQLSFGAALSSYVAGRRHDFDVLHVHGLGLHGGAVARVARRVGWASVVKVATARVGEAGLSGHRFARTRRTLMRAFDRYVALTGEIAAALQSDGIPARRIVRIPNLVDLDRFRPATPQERTELRAGLGWPRSAFVVLTTSRLERRKGLHVLIDALARAERDQIQLAIAGDGPERAALEAQAAARGLSARVRFHGTIAHPERWLEAADAFALPSSLEGMPNGLLEALACGLPAMASRIPGVTDIVGDDGARLCAPDSVDEWRHALEDLAGSADLRRRLADEGRRSVQPFGRDAVVDAYVSLYEGLRPRP